MFFTTEKTGIHWPLNSAPNPKLPLAEKQREKSVVLLCVSMLFYSYNSFRGSSRKRTLSEREKGVCNRLESVAYENGSHMRPLEYLEGPT